MSDRPFLVAVGTYQGGMSATEAALLVAETLHQAAQARFGYDPNCRYSVYADEPLELACGDRAMLEADLLAEPGAERYLAEILAQWDATAHPVAATHEQRDMRRMARNN